MKDYLQNKYLDSLNENYKKLELYYNDKLNHFISLNSLRNEILDCLTLNLNQASIFSTSHFLERMLKLSLITNHTLGLTYDDDINYNEKTFEAIRLYDRLNLSESIKINLDKKLINDDEVEILDYFRKKVRNPYSHAEIKKIIEDAPNEFTGFMFNLNDVMESLQKGEKIKEGEKKVITTYSSTFAQIYQEDFSNQLALIYFESIYVIMKNIESRL